MDKIPKPPKLDTGAHAVYSHLKDRPLSFSEACAIYSQERLRLSGSRPNSKYVNLTVLRLLRKYGHKTGKAGSKAPWVFGPEYFKVGDRVKYVGPISPELHYLRGEVLDLDQRDGYVGVRWNNWVDDPGCRTQDPVDTLALDETPDVTVTAEPVVQEPSFQIDSLVRYNGPVKQDVGMLGRVMSVGLVGPGVEVLWATTNERSYENVENLELYKKEISKTGLKTMVGHIPRFATGERVRYVGPSEWFKDPENIGVILEFFPANGRYQVQWPKMRTTEREENFELCLEKKVEPPKPVFKVGDMVSCKVGLLTFPGKVFLGPMSNGTYQVTAPNGVKEWVNGQDMSLIVGLPYQATVQKPEYDGRAETSLETVHKERELICANDELKALKERIVRIEKELGDCINRDQQTHWAKQLLVTLTPVQVLALKSLLGDVK